MKTKKLFSFNSLAFGFLKIITDFNTLILITKTRKGGISFVLFFFFLLKKYFLLVALTTLHISVSTVKYLIENSSLRHCYG